MNAFIESFGVPSLVFHPDEATVSRYARQLILPEFGGPLAQRRLQDARVLVVGCGGLGCPAALYLAGAGIGTLGLADRDTVDVTNLHRQIGHTTERVGERKTASLAKTIAALNPLVNVQLHDCGIDTENARQVVRQYDVVLDCSDNAETRYTVSDACVAEQRPLVSAAAVGLEAQLALLNYGLDGPCYRCIFPECPPPECQGSCDTDGVLGMVPGMIGTLQALEAVRVLLVQSQIGALGLPLAGRMLLFDALSYRFRLVQLRPRQTAKCSVCATFAPKLSRMVHDTGMRSKTSSSIDALRGDDTSESSPHTRDEIWLAQHGTKSEMVSPETPLNTAPHSISETLESNACRTTPQQRNTFHGDRGACELCRSATAETGTKSVGEAADSRLEYRHRHQRNETSNHSGPSWDARESQSKQSVTETVVVDVRPANQFALCHIRGALNFPMHSWPEAIENQREKLQGQRIRIVCRRGIQSRRAVRMLEALSWPDTHVEDIPGGMEALVRLQQSADGSRANVTSQTRSDAGVPSQLAQCEPPGGST